MDAATVDSHVVTVEPRRNSSTSDGTSAQAPSAGAPSATARDADSSQQPEASAPTPTSAGAIRATGGIRTEAYAAVERTDPFVRSPVPSSQSGEEESRYGERAVQLPVTPRSDATRRESAPAVQRPASERPLAQLLVFALLISTIVLVSAAVGVVVGRWMAQR
jgi:hypothetical protein